MKYLVISDIHGSITALETVFEVVKNWEIDKILILGDLLNHGPRNPLPEGYEPQRVAEFLNAKKKQIIAIKGNCDSEVDQMLCQFPIMSPMNIIPGKKRSIYMTHGHLWKPDEIGSMTENDLFLFGHTHLPKIEKTDYGVLVNPGSISLPKGNHPPTFAIIEKKVITIYTLDGLIYNQINE